MPRTRRATRRARRRAEGGRMNLKDLRAKATGGDVMALGASGVMIAPPNTLRTDDSIVQYYKQACEAIGSDVPFVIQDYPLTFSVQMTPMVIRRVATETASCWFLKHEDWPGLEKI